MGNNFRHFKSKAKVFVNFTIPLFQSRCNWQIVKSTVYFNCILTDGYNNVNEKRFKIQLGNFALSQLKQFHWYLFSISPWYRLKQYDEHNLVSLH